MSDGKKKYRVVLIEDNMMDIELAMEAFRHVGVAENVYLIRNGKEAIEYLKKLSARVERKARGLPDLILLDLQLPFIDGVEVLRRVKATRFLKRVPVIVFSTSEREIDRALCYDHGANSYLVKPVSFHDLVNIVERIKSYWLDANIGPPGE